MPTREKTAAARLDAETLRRLVALRWLLLEALERSRHATQLGRHVALVLLDGACERSMSLAWDRALPHKSPPRRFPDVGAQLIQELGASWHGGSWAGVSTLHSMRNPVQHAGGVPDVDQVRAWARDAERFVYGLVQHVYEANLESVLLATAIEDPELQAQFAAAERELEAGHPAKAFETAWAVFAEARSRWRPSEQRGWRVRDLLGEGTSDSTARATASDAINLLGAFTFAPEPAEYIWLRDLRTAANHGAPVEPDEATRALSFVFTWVLRWEAFAAHHDPDRVHRWQAESRPPLLSDAPGPMILPLGEPEVVAPRDWEGDRSALLASVSFRIVNVDPEDVSAWRRALDEAVRHLVEQAGFAPRIVSVQQDGTVAFSGLSVDVDLARLRSFIRQGLELADEQLRRARARRERWKRERDQKLVPFRQALEDIRIDGQPVFGKFSATPGDDWPSNPNAFRVEVDVPNDPLGIPTSISIAAHNLSQSMEASVSASASKIVFNGDQDPQAIRGLILAAVAQVGPARARKQELLGMIDAEQRRLKVDLDRLSLP